MQPHGDKLRNGLSLLHLNILLLEERRHHKVHSRQFWRGVQDAYFPEIEVIEEIVPILQLKGVHVIRALLLVFRKVDVFDIRDIFNHPAQQDSDQFGLNNPEDLLCLEDDPRNVSVFLIRDGDCWSHAGIAKRLGIRKMLLAIFINEEGLSAHRGNTLPTGFFVSALVMQVLEVV